MARLGKISSLADRELLASMKRIAGTERVLSAYGLAHLGEIQRRDLFKEVGYPSMFYYCVGELGYSEPNASRRIRAAEAARRFPDVLTMIKDGSLTVCALAMIAKHLTPENRESLLKQVEGKSVRALERILVQLDPLPDSKDLIRSMPIPVSDEKIDLWSPMMVPAFPCPAVPSVQPRPPERILPRAPERFQFSFTGSEVLRTVIERLKDILSNKYPEGHLEDILLEVGKAYLQRKDPELLPPSKPKPSRATQTRTVPRWVRSIVYRRDEGRCVFQSAGGRRCEARRSLEYDHVRPWARGGTSDDPKNIRLLCRAHNQWAAREAGLTA